MKMSHYLNTKAVPSLWLAVPITTLLGISFARLYTGVSRNLFDTVASPSVSTF